MSNPHPLTVERRTPTPTSFRAAKVRGMFDLDVPEIVFSASVPVALPERWSIGAIVGNSGSGKSTVARELFPEEMAAQSLWTKPCILDDFPTGMTPQEIVNALTGVGLSSPKAWLLPHHALSVGQQFRADLALRLASSPRVVFDEYTSTVDRTVAKAASVAVSKLVRRTGTQFVAVACHSDILPWLTPDWTINMSDQTFHLAREDLRRPNIKLNVYPGPVSAWAMFRQHHYLSGDIHPAARAFHAYVELDGAEHLAGFFSILPAMGMTGWRRGHRTCVLPDFQGFGIGNAMIEQVAEALWTREGLRFRATTSAPQIVQHRLRRPEMWRLSDGPRQKQPNSRNSKRYYKTSAGRLSTSWEYLPTTLRKPSPWPATAAPTALT